MEEEELLLSRLKRYAASDTYPFHMPGHKRITGNLSEGFPNPYEIDITEIDGFDNLHHAEGILKQSMEWAASLYGADKSYYLVNGSTGGILSAISAVGGLKNHTDNSDTILLSRNCHKSAYHGVFLNNLRCSYVYPQTLVDYGVQGGLLPGEIEKILETNVDISGVFVVSPTYDGIVSDIKTIAKIAHKYGVPLIVDEAHGAHFRYSDAFPVSALELGADIVIQSVHKTLPCLTQSAILHVKQGYVDVECLERYLSIYQSSSPSYVLMAGIEAGIFWMEQQRGKDENGQIQAFVDRLQQARNQLRKMRHFRLLGEEVIGTQGVFDLDISKIVISTRGTGWNGEMLSEALRERFHLEMEMCGADYVTAIATVMDSQEGLERLGRAMTALDAELDGIGDTMGRNISEKQGEIARAKPVMKISEAVFQGREKCRLRESEGKISAEYIYLYPPGIPVIAPGEIIQKELLDMIVHYQEMGLPVQGPADERLEWIRVVEKK